MDITSLHRSFVAVLEPPAVYERHNTGKLIDVVRGPSEVQSLLILDCGVQEAISQELETNFQVQVTAVDLCQESGDAGRSHGAQEQVVRAGSVDSANSDSRRTLHLTLCC